MRTCATTIRAGYLCKDMKSGQGKLHSVQVPTQDKDGKVRTSEHLTGMYAHVYVFVCMFITHISLHTHTQEHTEAHGQVHVDLREHANTHARVHAHVLVHEICTDIHIRRKT